MVVQLCSLKTYGCIKQLSVGGWLPEKLKIRIVQPRYAQVPAWGPGERYPWFNNPGATSSQWSDTMCTSHGQTKGTPTLSSTNISQRLCHCISLLSAHKGVITHSSPYQALAAQWCNPRLKLKCKHAEEKDTRCVSSWLSFTERRRASFVRCPMRRWLDCLCCWHIMTTLKSTTPNT